LKEILYDCAVEIRATKAALYLFDGTSRFELITEYGFRGAIRASADTNDPMVDRCGRGRTAFFVNGMATEPRFSQLMYDSSTDRVLAAPLYSRGKLIGFLDMRDKAGKLAFEQTDAAKAQSIADRLVELLADRNIFGHRFITLSRVGGPAAPPEEAPEAPPSNISGEAPIQHLPNTLPSPARQTGARPAAVAPAPPVPQEPSRVHVPRLATLVIEARTIAGRIIASPPQESLRETELDAAREVLRSILLIPGAVAATFTAYGHLGGVQELVVRSSITDEAKNLIQSKLNVWLTKRGEASGFIKTAVLTSPGASGPPVAATDIQKVFTAPLTVGALRGLYLTVAFSGNPERLGHELLGILHGHLQVAIEQSMQRGALGALQARVAEKLLEPDFSRYPELRRHSEAVAGLAENLARHLGLPPAEVENARIVGLVHDAGMRLLDYERLYRKNELTPEELGFLREHPVIGAAMVEPLLGTEIARAVLCHHERVDGRGYPNELHGEEIPLLSRIVQICDAWVAMTDPDSYQPAESAEEAIATIRQAAGGQFDASIAGSFVEMRRLRTGRSAN